MARRSAGTGKPGGSRQARAGGVPVFSLYGETDAAEAEFVHIEDIRARSERYHWRIAPHTHRGLYQILFVLRGGAGVRADAWTGEVEAPFAMSIPPAAIHSFRFRPRTHGYVLTFAEAMLPLQARHRALVEELFVEPRLISFAAAPAAAARVGALMEQIMAELREDAPGRAAMQEWLVGAVLLLIARAQASAAQSADRGRRQRAFNRFRALVEAHFLSHWPVARYAAALGLTEGRLNRLTRAVAGKSAFDLIQDRLLLEARRKLIYVAAPISLLAYELGFEDPAYFSRYFRTRVGMTPSAFRQAAKGG